MHTETSVVNAAVSNAARGKPARDRLATLHFPMTIHLSYLALCYKFLIYKAYV